VATDPVIDAWSALVNELNLFVPVLMETSRRRVERAHASWKGLDSLSEA
jgi:hypothetical protein